MRKCSDCEKLNYRILSSGKGLCLYRWKVIQPWKDHAKTLVATICKGYKPRKEIP